MGDGGLHLPGHPLVLVVEQLFPHVDFKILHVQPHDVARAHRSFSHIIRQEGKSQAIDHQFADQICAADFQDGLNFTGEAGQMFMQKAAVAHVLLGEHKGLGEQIIDGEDALMRKRMPEGCFIVGRHMMTCCADDIQFAGLVVEWEKAAEVKDDSWMVLTAKINFRRHKAYSGVGPVLSYIGHEYCDMPRQPVASF